MGMNSRVRWQRDSWRTFVPLLTASLIVMACDSGKPEAAPPATSGAGVASAKAPTESAADKGGPIVIGAAIAQTGFFSAFDTAAYRGSVLATEDINAKGGVSGRQLQIIAGDMKSDRTLGANVAVEQLGKGAKLLLVSCDFDIGSPAAIAATEKGVLAFSLCASSSKFGPKGIGPLAFTPSTATNAKGFAIAEWAYARGWRTAYLIGDRISHYSKTYPQYFKERFVELAGKDSILGEDTFMNSDPSIAAQITRIKALGKKPDLIFFCSVPPGGASAVRQIRAAGLDMPIAACGAMDGTFWLESIPNLSNFYSIAAASIYGDDPEPRINDLVQRYKKKFNEDPVQYLPALGYSGVELFAKAVAKAGSTDGDALRKVLEQFVDEPTITGPMTFNQQWHINLAHPMRMTEVAGGKRKFTGMVTPSKVSEKEYN